VRSLNGRTKKKNETGFGLRLWRRGLCLGKSAEGANQNYGYSGDGNKKENPGLIGGGKRKGVGKTDRNPRVSRRQLGGGKLHLV